MFLRGLPSLCLKMKRPPKGKSAAPAAARNAAGAERSTPDFYRISRIAPLPPSTPFTPAVAQETTNANDDAPRHAIESLEVEDTVNYDILGGDIDDVQLMVGWPGNLPFSDPFEEDSSDSDSGRKRRKVESRDASNRKWPSQESGPQSGAKVLASRSTAADDTKSLTSVEKNNANVKTSSVEDSSKEAEESQQLTKADLCYLDHQNRILLLYVEKEVAGEKSGAATQV
jgi:hypothetical protein